MEKKSTQRRSSNLFICRGRLGVGSTQLNSLKIIWIQRLLNTTNALWKYVMFFVSIELNSEFLSRPTAF